MSDQQVKGKDTNTGRVYFPNLDGLRWFCFLAVFFFHCFGTRHEHLKAAPAYRFVDQFLFSNGNLGVNCFFVLSGFLITYLLLVEKEKYQKINVKSFYLRRILRIWPLFYLCVLLGFYAFPLMKMAFHEQPNETANISYYLLFINNFDLINNGLPDSSLLGLLWSVAIEEQFYLVWPLLITIVPRKFLPALFTSIIVCSLVYRYIHASNPAILEHHTLSCISDMTVGAFAAWFAFHRPKTISFFGSLPRPAIVLLYLMLAAIFWSRKEIFHHGAILLSIDRLVISILFALLILEQNFATHSFFKFSNWKQISRLGTYTYGMYCLHKLAILVSSKGLALLHVNDNIFGLLFVETLLSLAITVALALLSFRYYESGFLKLKKRFERVKTPY